MKRLVIVGGSGMVGGYAILQQLNARMTNDDVTMLGVHIVGLLCGDVSR
jgi:hypothetical protein